MKILKSDFDKLLLDGQEYDTQEIRDIVTQIEKEKQTPDGGDFIIFHGKTFKVKRATFGVVRKVMQNEFEFHYKQLASLTEQILEGKQKLLVMFPFLLRRIERRFNKMLLKEWRQFVELTFEGDLKEMDFENLTQSEVIRLKRIFFRFRQGQNQEKPDK